MGISSCKQTKTENQTFFLFQIKIIKYDLFINKYSRISLFLNRLRTKASSCCPLHLALYEDPIQANFFSLSYSSSLLDFVCKIYNSSEFSNFTSHPFLTQKIYQGPKIEFESIFDIFIRNNASENRRKHEKMKKNYYVENVKETKKIKMPEKNIQEAKKERIPEIQTETNRIKHTEKNHLKIEKEIKNDQNNKIAKSGKEKSRKNNIDEQNCKKVKADNKIHNIWKNLEILISKLKEENKSLNQINNNTDLINYFSKRCGIEKIEITKRIKDLWEKHPN